VEIALRNLAQAARANVCVADGVRPTVLVRRDDVCLTPYAITIQFEGIESAAPSTLFHGYPSRRVIWQLGRADAPWPTGGESAKSPALYGLKRCSYFAVRAPQANVIWRWASQIFDDLDSLNSEALAAEAEALLGLVSL
jgi:hypothetical protein